MPVPLLLRLASLSAALLMAGAGEAARADRRGANDKALRDRAHRYQVEVAHRWRPLAAPAGTLVAYAPEDGRAHLAITRVELGTRSIRDPAALAEQVERGVESATRGYRRRRRTLSAAQVPVLDLSYERAAASGRELVLSRYLFFTRHTMVLSIGLADGAHRRQRRAAEAMVRSFAPYP